MESVMTPVFLHGGWRCGSTYVWNRFRALAGTLSFCEPFHERLANCTVESIARDTGDSWDSRHPALDAPYFTEYVPLVDGAGVSFYDPSFAVRRYFVEETQHLYEQSYLSLLLEYAR